MAPILIDNQGLIKLGLISVLSTVIVFAAGFLSGYQQATTFYAAGSEIETLALPVQAVFLEGDVEPQLPDTIVAGADIDVDQPRAESETNAKDSAVVPKALSTSNKEDVNKTNKAPTSNKLASLEKIGKPSNKESSDDKNIINKNNLISIKGSSIKEAVTSNSFQKKSGRSVATKEPGFMVVASLTPAELNNIKYSIQVGIYGRLINAENMVKMLQAQNLNAYVSDYVNKKNENRYNVRFGYFVDKKSALSALNKYKNKQKGDGYLVNFSVENITKLADARDLKQSTTTKEAEKKPLPATAPLETTGDKVSQTDVVSASTVLAGAQSQAVVEMLPDVRVRVVTK
jgi:cell division septation protein DedD